MMLQPSIYLGGNSVFRHPQLGTVQYSTTVLPDDPDGQVDATIAIMRRYVLEDCGRPEIQRDLASAVGSTGYPVSLHAVIEHIFNYVKRKITFTQDYDIAGPLSQAGVLPADKPVVEVLVRPVDISLGAHTGDCDDYSMYTAALLAAAGIQCAFVTVAADPDLPTNFSHVYVAAYIPGNIGLQRVAMDTSHGDVAGWEVENRYGRRREWPINTVDGGDASWQ